MPGSGNFNFSYQHDARFRRTDAITFWNNANNGLSEPSAAASSAMEVQIDEVGQTATLVWEAVAPSRALDVSQGNHQILPNGNHFCALGSVPEVFETTPDGKVVALDATIGGMPMRSYRAFKYDWTGLPPTSELSLFLYAKRCRPSLVFYVSWNGATEVAMYRFFAGNTSAGVFVEAGSVSKGGEFETRHVSSQFGKLGYAEAYDSTGKLLGTTRHVDTFVPAASLTDCNDVQCPRDLSYAVAPQASCSD